MPDLQTRFTEAQQVALATKTDNSTMLRLYALYKQATLGDASGERPGAFDFVKRAKFDAWAGVRGMSIEDAMQKYVDLVATLQS